MLATLKDMNGFEGKYKISEEGEIYSIRGDKEIPRKLWANPVTGYLEIVLRKDNKDHVKLVHRLVAENFVDNPQRLPHVEHIDGDKKNNHVSNIRWVKHRGNKGNKSKLQRVRRCDTGEEFRGLISASKSVKGTQPGLLYALRRDGMYKGVQFEIIEEE